MLVYEIKLQLKMLFYDNHNIHVDNKLLVKQCSGNKPKYTKIKGVEIN